MADSLPPDVIDHLALALVPGLGPRLTAALIERFGSAGAARQATAAQLRDIPHIGEKTANEFAAALRAVKLDNELQLLEKHAVRVLPLGYQNYPSPLAAMENSPPLLYLRGEWLQADATAVAIVGSRACTTYGKRIAEQIARGLAKVGVTVVSGLARGIDAVAHRAALDAGGRTIAVLAGGLTAIYPPEHAELAEEITRRGALITETPMTLPPQPGMFPARNRLISGLSRGVIVVEANIRSGALITARHALEQGREVFAVPGQADSPASAGCLELIRSGARLVRSADDVLEDLHGVRPPVDGQATSRPISAAPDGSEPKLLDNLNRSADTLPAPPPEIAGPPPGLEPLQMRVWEMLDARRHADQLTRDLGVTVGELAMVLMQLEVKRLIRRMPGNYYERR